MENNNFDLVKIRQVRAHQLEGGWMLISLVGMMVFFLSLINIINGENLYLLVLMVSFVYPIIKFISIRKLMLHIKSSQVDELMLMNPSAGYLLIKSGRQKGMALGVVIKGSVGHKEVSILSYMMVSNQKELDQRISEINKMNTLSISVVKNTFIESNFKKQP